MTASMPCVRVDTSSCISSVQHLADLLHACACFCRVMVARRQLLQPASRVVFHTASLLLSLPLTHEERLHSLRSSLHQLVHQDFQRKRSVTSSSSTKSSWDQVTPSTAPLAHLRPFLAHLEVYLVPASHSRSTCCVLNFSLLQRSRELQAASFYLPAAGCSPRPC